MEAIDVDTTKIRILSERGFTLVEATITVAIVSIMAIGSATLMSDMSRESARFRRSQARTNFEQKFVSLYQNADLCSCNLGGATPLAISDTVSVPVVGLKSGCTTPTFDTFDASAVGGFQVDTNLAVSTITVSNPQLISGNNYTATTTVNYADSENYGSLRPAQFLLMFTTLPRALRS